MFLETPTPEEIKKMRTGFTTGACATAVTKAALSALITKDKQLEASIYLPVGKFATFKIESCEFNENEVTCGTIKDGGDDPDATHQALILATVSWCDGSDIVIDGGIGVGRVTKPGLPISVGEAAINPVPRKMIYDTAKEVLDKFGLTRGIKIIISVPDGEEIAKKTLNSRLGIIGGISILGTRGIVIPFSASSYKASIIYGIQVALEGGCDHVVITTGGRSERYGMKQFPELPEEAFIEMGDFVGFTLRQCKRLGVKRVSMVGMLGKFSKVAQGIMMVHARSMPIDFGFLADVAAKSGVTGELLDKIRNANTAAQVGEFIIEHGYYDFFNNLCKSCCSEALKEVGGGLRVDTTLYTLNGEFLGKAAIFD